MKVAFLALSLAVAGASAALPFGDHICPDKQQHCADGMPCCAFSGTDGGYGCCSGGNTEACCSDDTGGVCCLSQPTSCIAKTAASPYPARCCGRETVGCGVGSVGCCNPARAWQRGAPLNPNALGARAASELFARGAKVAEEIQVVEVSEEDLEALAANASLAYALVVGGFSGKLQALTIDITTAAVVAKKTVNDFNNWGESTRDFLYDASRNVFYMLDVDFVAEPTRPSTGRKVTLFTIDPTTGNVDTKAVTGGLVDYVTGYSMHEKSGRIHAAAEKIVGNEVVGFEFYWVDPSTGVSEHITSLPRDNEKGENDLGFYGGYHRVVDVDGKAYRIGYQFVSSQQKPGLFSVDAKAATDAQQIPLPKELDFYLGAVKSPVDQDGFISLLRLHSPMTPLRRVVE